MVKPHLFFGRQTAKWTLRGGDSLLYHSRQGGSVYLQSRKTLQVHPQMRVYIRRTLRASALRPERRSFMYVHRDKRCGTASVEERRARERETGQSLSLSLSHSLCFCGCINIRVETRRCKGISPYQRGASPSFSICTCTSVHVYVFLLLLLWRKVRHAGEFRGGAFASRKKRFSGTKEEAYEK